ncbi:hypothetical protein [Actinomadura sp. WMMB 499]|uniref:hypothetical protein n=1 Tax=Actinomadura sp. WMMB 499 TaxID=1219491 RepID=UPI0012467A92|nr:hypothetical protein [Actinomadura sp. WMMB 499]QFG23564.1 hypothetical protein F7P10_23025 [Actinomadura sp. WMMB 499]
MDVLNKIPESARDTTIRVARITLRDPMFITDARLAAFVGLFARNVRQELACCAQWWQGNTL